MKRIWHAYAAFRARNQGYFQRCEAQIAQNNLRMLQAALWVLLPFFLLYGIWTTITMRNPLLIACYAAIYAALLGLFALTRRFRRQPPAPRTVQAACYLCVCMLMAFIITISIFPFPKQPALFYSLCYIIVATLFFFPYQRISLLMTGISGIYLLLVALFRPQEVAIFDHFSAVTTWLATSFFLLLICDLRLRSGEAQEQLEKASRTDSLTSLLNRHGAQVHMFPSFRRCQESHLPVAVTMIDVDRFKDYNDALGHPAGDDCLRTIGRTLATFAVEHGFFAARYGGEEFLLFMSSVSTEKAQSLSNELLERVRQKAIAGPNGIVTISAGVAVRRPGPQDTLEELILRADEALYRAKGAGRNQVIVTDLESI